MTYKNIVCKAIEISAHLYGAKQEDIISEGRDEVHVQCRACVYYAIYKATDFGYREITEFIPRDRTTIFAAMQKIYKIQRLNAKNRSAPQERFLENAETTKALLQTYIRNGV